ncbi:MAG: glycine--tRNA ligase [Planctomycetota bacterium]
MSRVPMETIVSLCKRRGFIFQNSEIYGGQNGFWDYGPLGVLLKRNVREAWWHDMLAGHDELAVPEVAPGTYQMTSVETSIVMHPQVWKCSGHYDLFHDHMVDCTESKKRYRHDQLTGRWAEHGGKRVFLAVNASGDEAESAVEDRALKVFGVRRKNLDDVTFDGGLVDLIDAAPDPGDVVAPDATKPGTLTEPREFNLMFPTTIGALGGEEDRAFLRPETAQGMFVNFKNVLDTSRVKIPFGIAQIGKSFRNEITPRNFTFRSREFEQMEMEFFCRPEQSFDWYQYWRDRRYKWYTDLGISPENLILRDHEQSELAHYSVGTADIEYAFPFLPEGEYGELEGVAHRGDFDLKSHMEGKLKKEGDALVVEQNEHGQPKYKGSGKDLTVFDDESKSRFTPHVIEPAAGADRGTLAFLCEAYHEDEAPDDKGNLQKRVVMKLHPRLAPIKVAVFPLLKKDGMPERAAEIYREFKKAGIEVQYDQQGAIGKRYRRQDEIGTPFCVTIDGETATDGTVTVRDRDSLTQDRVKVEEIVDRVRAGISP